MKRRTLLVALSTCALSLTGANAQSWPSKPLTLIVPWPAGGNTDFMARTLGQELGRQLGQPVVIENLGGAGGVLGLQKASASAPDGYTLYLGGTELVVPPMVNPKLSYDWKKRFTPLGQFGFVWFVLAAPVDAPFSTLPEMIRYARANPGALTYATPGVASTQHILGESIRERAGVQIVHVPYRGGPQLVQDLVGGQVGVGFLTVNGMLANLASGKLKPIAVSGDKRSPFLPQVPAMNEVKEFADLAMGAWMGIFVPAGVPAAVVARLSSALEASLKQPAVREPLEKAGAVVAFNDAAAFTSFVDQETANYRRVVEFARMRTNE